MTKSLTDRTISGLNWNFVSTYSNSISTIIIGIILARLLTPTDFGLVGMVTIFIGLADLFVTLGMGRAVVRFQVVTEKHIRVATTITILSSIIIFITFQLLAPLISDFYNQKNLTTILRVLSLLFIIKGINTVSYAQLQKKLEFKTITLIAISSNITYGIISIIFAFLGYGVWSLVFGRLSSSIIAAILTTRKYPVNMIPLVSKNEFKDLAGFGSGVSISNILLYGSSNIDYLIIGKLANPAVLGLYTKAFNLMTNSINKISGGMFNVLFPAFSSVQNEKDKLRRAYLRAVRTATYFIFPILGILIVSSEYIIIGLYGKEWAGAIVTFQILAFGGILRSTLMFSGAIAYATGRIFIESRQQLIYLIILSIGAYLGIQYGIEGVAVAVVLALIWMFFAQTRLAIKIIESSWREFLSSLFPALFNLFSAALFNLLLIFVLKNLFGIILYEINLLLIIFCNIVFLLTIIIFCPYAIKKDTIDWIINKYSRFIPPKILKFYFLFNKSPNPVVNTNLPLPEVQRNEMK